MSTERAARYLRYVQRLTETGLNAAQAARRARLAVTDEPEREDHEHSQHDQQRPSESTGPENPGSPPKIGPRTGLDEAGYARPVVSTPSPAVECGYAPHDLVIMSDESRSYEVLEISPGDATTSAALLLAPLRCDDDREPFWTEVTDVRPVYRVTWDGDTIGRSTNVMPGTIYGWGEDEIIEQVRSIGYRHLTLHRDLVVTLNRVAGRLALTRYGAVLAVGQLIRRTVSIQMSQLNR